jgi:putative glutamine amidotransferase
MFKLEHPGDSIPIIGLPARMDPGTDSQYLSRQYADAVCAAGGTPVILPLLDDPRAIRHLVENLDGILLTGSSSDIDPNRYGVSREPGCGPVQPLRDETDFMLLEVALERKKPVLAICFGMQSLNVFMGGTLIQDIMSSKPETRIRHMAPESEGRPSHDVEILAGSILETLAEGEPPRVNSTHHQALDRLGSGLEVIARAPDGIVESVRGIAGDGFILGVQWHPEKSFGYDALSTNIFKLFLQRCREQANRP